MYILPRSYFRSNFVLQIDVYAIGCQIRAVTIFSLYSVIELGLGNAHAQDTPVTLCYMTTYNEQRNKMLKSLH